MSDEAGEKVEKAKKPGVKARGRAKAKVNAKAKKSESEEPALEVIPRSDPDGPDIWEISEQQFRAVVSIPSLTLQSSLHAAV